MDTATQSALIAAGAAIVIGYLTSFAAESYRRFKDGSSIAAALAGELNSYLQGLSRAKAAITSLIDIAEGDAPKTLPTPKEQADTVFNAAAERLGLLGPSLVEDLVFVYHQVRAFRGTFAIATQSDFAMRRALLVSCLPLIDNAEAHGGPLIPKLRERAKDWYLLSALARKLGSVCEKLGKKQRGRERPV